MLYATFDGLVLLILLDMSTMAPVVPNAQALGQSDSDWWGHTFSIQQTRLWVPM